MSDSPWMHISVSEGESERSQGALRFMRGGWEEGLVGVGVEEGLVGGLVSRLVSRISTDALCPECQPARSRGFLAPILMLSGGLPKSPAGSGRRVHQRYLGQRLLLSRASPSGCLVPQPSRFGSGRPCPASRGCTLSPVQPARARPATPLQNTSASVACCPLLSGYLLSFWTQLCYCHLSNAPEGSSCPAPLSF